jgi:uncharacterized hydrophobic protein (TIGR00271 family)
LLRLRLSVRPEHATSVAERLDRTGGVRRLVSSPSGATGDEVVLSADVVPSGADEVMEILEDLEVHPDDFLLARTEVIAPSSVGPRRATEVDGFAWVTVMGEARANSRPLARYLALMIVAGIIAGLGVLEDNAILVVGAMAVSPDLLPICSTCVGIVGRRWPLARRAFLTLTVGLALAVAVSAVMTALLDATGIISGEFRVGERGLGSLANVDYSTVLVALAAGVAAMLAFETRASASVGVAISVTTVPASAFMGVAIGAGELHDAGGAALVLTVNVVLLILSGSLTLWIQRRLIGARGPDPIGGSCG